MKTIKIDGERYPTLAAFLTRLGQELPFPNYFNGNLNSFEEILNDLTWLSPEFNIVKLDISGFKDFSARRSPG